MKTTGFQDSWLPGRQVPRPVWLAAKWDSLVKASVHAPVAASQAAPRNLTSVVKSKFAGTLPSGLSPTVPNLWVEKGVIWQLPNLLVGFTSHSAATGFFFLGQELGIRIGLFKLV